MITFLTYSVIILAIVSMVYLARIADLTRDLKGGNEADVPQSENKQSALGFIIFMVGLFASYIWLIQEYMPMTLPQAASEHGAKIDGLMNINLIVVNIVFVVINILLFVFAFKYESSKREKADFYPHNNTLELIWTIIPSIFLAVIITWGLYVWSGIHQIKVDSTLWIAGLGLLITGAAIIGLLKNLVAEIRVTVGGSLMLFGAFFCSYFFIAKNSINTEVSEEPLVIELYARQFDWTARYAGADQKLGAAHVRYIDGANTVGINTEDKAGLDDQIVRNEFHIPKGKPVRFVIRSQDVIHSAYMPHFRAQVNAVPGMPTSMSFTPTITTQEMRADEKTRKKYEKINKIREKRGEEPIEFNYVLLCNKICGATHYNMKMDIVVDTPEDYQKWLSEQKTLTEVLGPSEEAQQEENIAQL